MSDSKYFFIKQRLKEIGKTQEMLAAALGIRATHINRSITGNREIQPNEIIPLCDFLGYDVEEFIKYYSGTTKDYSHLVKNEEKKKICENDLIELCYIINDFLLKNNKKNDAISVIKLAFMIYDSVKNENKNDWERSIHMLLGFYNKNNRG